jgi:hypothetical protein
MVDGVVDDDCDQSVIKTRFPGGSPSFRKPVTSGNAENTGCPERESNPHDLSVKGV